VAGEVEHLLNAEVLHPRKEWHGRGQGDEGGLPRQDGDDDGPHRDNGGAVAIGCNGTRVGHAHTPPGYQDQTTGQSPADRREDRVKNNASSEEGEQPYGRDERKRVKARRHGARETVECRRYSAQASRVPLGRAELTCY